MPPDLSERAAALRFSMIVLIVAFHAQPVQDAATLVGPPLAFLRFALPDVGARAGVPVLTALSGYLLFAGGADRAPWRLARRKARTLLAPLVIWNLPVVLLLAGLQASGWSGDGFARFWPPDAWQAIDATLGLTGLSANYPLTFLRDLFVLAALAPVLGPCLRRAPAMTVAASFALFMAWDGPVLIREQMLVAFALGGAAAARPAWLRRLDGHGLACIAVFVLGCFVIAGAGSVPGLAVQVFALLAVPLLWAAAGRVPTGGAARLAPASFFLFVAHAPVVAASWIVWRRLPVPAELHWLVGPALAIGLLLAIYRLVLPLLPRRPVLVALGGRFTPTSAGAPRRRG